MSIYFIDAQHEANFAKVLDQWPLGTRNVEYQPACYILACPMIYAKVQHLTGVESGKCGFTTLRNQSNPI